MTTNRRIAPAIAELQAFMNLSFTRMGARLGVDRMTVFGYVKRDSQPSLQVLGALAQLADELGRSDLEGIFLEPFAAVLGKSARHIPDLSIDKEAA